LLAYARLDDAGANDDDDSPTDHRRAVNDNHDNDNDDRAPDRGTDDDLAADPNTRLEWCAGRTARGHAAVQRWRGCQYVRLPVSVAAVTGHGARRVSEHSERGRQRR
jgi:hypothetical protein